jgi:hypothetical protein
MSDADIEEEVVDTKSNPAFPGTCLYMSCEEVLVCFLARVCTCPVRQFWCVSWHVSVHVL